MKDKEPVKSTKPHPFDSFWEFQRKKSERSGKKEESKSKPYWW
ncbi:hypothetical protein KP77_20140 [Jeotgalibacillus alimentarius]|uniref:Uncharacterized protein n=1 Tax=Jeotgalibacillus alimentarius TaxID=135826 RepID=A0A0C2VXV0_9BACL|nr:hypothetical protein [Jeotgalibacillus alimentarius]KIL48803.1 hypothetical protein KP77_20140 [Jeotgalibacillus alimentarius]